MCGLVAALYQLMHTTGSDTCCIPFQKITAAVGAPCWCPKEPGVTSVCVHTPDCLHCRCKHVSLCCYLSVNRSVYCMCECVYWKPKYGNQSFVFRSVILKWWVVTQNWAVGINLACCGAGGYNYYSFLQYTQQRTQPWFKCEVVHKCILKYAVLWISLFYLNYVNTFTEMWAIFCHRCNYYWVHVLYMSS